VLWLLFIFLTVISLAADWAGDPLPMLKMLLDLSSELAERMLDSFFKWDFLLFYRDPLSGELASGAMGSLFILLLLIFSRSMVRVLYWVLAAIRFTNDFC